MPPKNKIRLVLADDHLAVRQGFVSCLSYQNNFEVVGEASNGLELLKIIEENKPDIALIDYEMPLMNGLETLKQIKSRKLKVKSIILTLHISKTLAAQTITEGASAFLTKDIDMMELVKAINGVYDEGFYINKKISKQIIVNHNRNGKLDTIAKKLALTEREIEILKLICVEKTNKEIAQLLNIKYDTVDFHRNNIYKKTCASSVVGLVKYAIKHGITEIE